MIAPTRLGVALGICALVVAGCAAPEQPAVQPVGPVEPAKVAPAPEAAAMPTPAADEKDRPFAVVRRVSQPPVIDGELGDAAWGEPIAGKFVDTVTGKPVDWPTTVWLVYDKDNLYVAAKMHEPDMGQLVCYVTDRDGDVWQDDALEIFLDPTNTHKEEVYYHIMVNAAGTLADRQGSPDSAGLDYAWDAQGMRAKAHRGKDYWAVELAIPLAALGVKQDPQGRHWAANFCRTRYGNEMESAWSNPGPETFHAPEAFGHIAFW
ncbi:MAG: carbohydrate-binding family 9-like protein [Phycisphaerae bacterium]